MVCAPLSCVVPQIYCHLLCTNVVWVNKIGLTGADEWKSTSSASAATFGAHPPIQNPHFLIALPAAVPVTGGKEEDKKHHSSASEEQYILFMENYRSGIKRMDLNSWNRTTIDKIICMYLSSLFHTRDTPS